MDAKAPALEQMNTERAEEEESHDEQTAEELRESLSAVDSQYTPQKDVPRRIHIVGTGSIGKIVAHALRGIDNPPPITLVFHRYKLLESWKSKRGITVQDEEYTIERRGFNVELTRPYRRMFGMKVNYGGEKKLYDLADETGIRPDEAVSIVKEQRQSDAPNASYRPFGGEEQQGVAMSRDLPNDEAAPSEGVEEERPLPGDSAVSDHPIFNLVITTKAIRTVSALLAIKHRITKDTTICFLQNGMGIIDDVNKEVFPDEATRPTYVQGIVSHGANVPPEKYEEDPFFVVHAGKGTIALGVVPNKSVAQATDNPATSRDSNAGDEGKLPEEQVDDLAPTARYLIRTLARTPVLCAVPFTPLELLQLQLEKLVVNTIINPLTSLLDNRNGSILHNFAISRTMRLMLAETSLVIRSLPELRGIPNVQDRFSTSRLEYLVTNGAMKTQNNISSMLADVRAGRKTEIEYINGYIVKRGEELGIKAVVNYAIMQIVIGKCNMVQQEITENMPFDGEPEGVNRE